jgi:hypothetical protein
MARPSVDVMACMRKLGWTAALLALGCQAGNELSCKDGEILIDGEPFTDCAQCGDSSSCDFVRTEEVEQSACMGPEGLPVYGQRALREVELTASCGDDSATLTRGACEGETVALEPCVYPAASPRCQQYCAAAVAACPDLPEAQCGAVCDNEEESTIRPNELVVAWHECMLAADEWVCSPIYAFGTDELRPAHVCLEEYIAVLEDSLYDWGNCAYDEDSGDCVCRLSQNNQDLEASCSSTDTCCYIGTSGVPRTGRQYTFDCVCVAAPDGGCADDLQGSHGYEFSTPVESCPPCAGRRVRRARRCARDTAG